ncbi:MAG: TerB family tellurite resistance protein [Candidatus Pelagibacterales bacterium]|jgi:DnaJ like chaperone protein
MSVWKYLMAASLGNMIAGPLGALAFTAGAYFLGGKKNFKNTDGQFNQQQGVYAIGLIVLAAKLAKADGHVTSDEIAKFKKIFRIPKADLKQVGLIWKQAAETSEGFEVYAQQLFKTFKRSPQMLEQIILGLFEIGYADHELSAPELKFIKQVSNIFQIDQHTFNRLRNSRPEYVKEDPYKVLGLKKSDSIAEIKKAYRTLARKNHPDVMRAKGITDISIIRKAKEKFQLINDAYEQILKIKGIK